MATAVYVWTKYAHAGGAQYGAVNANATTSRKRQLIWIVLLELLMNDRHEHGDRGRPYPLQPLQAS